jgi:hypothetical protein
VPSDQGVEVRSTVATRHVYLAELANNDARNVGPGPLCFWDYTQSVESSAGMESTRVLLSSLPVEFKNTSVSPRKRQLVDAAVVVPSYRNFDAKFSIDGPRFECSQSPLG